MVKGRTTMAKRNRMWNKAIVALMNHPNLASAAASIDVHPDTLDNWLHQEDFTEALRKAQDDALGHGIVKLNLRITETIDALHQIVMDEENPAAVRVAAASKELEIVTRTVAARSQAAEFKRLTEEIDELKQTREENESNAKANAQPQAQSQSQSGIIEGEIVSVTFVDSSEATTKAKASKGPKAKAVKAPDKQNQRTRANSGMAALIAGQGSEEDEGDDQGG